jgi:hypothetical protein
MREPRVTEEHTEEHKVEHERLAAELDGDRQTDSVRPSSKEHW